MIEQHRDALPDRALSLIRSVRHCQRALLRAHSTGNIDWWHHVAERVVC